ncbi:hypothetical protein [Denitromonas iodatirespirans]|uniref:Uncharacterized protein n=1 Tax=Denitromonas iodatirespirans TaxID=2795389 RepID=A0A944DC19_DENI1|nr:hypothetical protein [Denitromonas iodatirespirans]MBT0963734.1 hypothetical protein [Denitromonas iodatirespirans]
MARAIDADFELLKDFLNSYTLGQVVTTAQQLATVKSAHKAFLPFLQLWAICLDEATKGSLMHFGRSIGAKDPELSHLREAISDTGSGFFCCLHGAYKPGHMALRSSIENFLRFAAGPFDNLALTTTSISGLFDIARATEPFAGGRNVHLNQLRSTYVALCKFSHSASLAHMEGIHALAHFPTFDEKAFQGWLGMARPCMSAIATLTVRGHPSLYLDAHYAAKELLDELIPQPERLLLLKGENSLSA